MTRQAREPSVLRVSSAGRGARSGGRWCSGLGGEQSQSAGATEVASTTEFRMRTYHNPGFAVVIDRGGYRRCWREEDT